MSELTRIFQKSKSSGSVNITMKRYDGKSKPCEKLDPSEFKCLFRAVLGNKKISTVVSPKEMNRFQLAYANVLKANMDGLKKKEKKTALSKKAKKDN